MSPSAKCKRCGRKLTDPYSIAIGMGPECRGKLIRAGHVLPKPAYKVMDGRVQLIGLKNKDGELLPVNRRDDDESQSNATEKEEKSES